MKRLKVCLINPRFEPSYWGFDYALPLYPGNIKSTMITGALPHLAGLIPNHEVCLIGSGARYSDGNITFFNKGDSALVEVNDQRVFRDCIVQRES